MKSAKVSYCLRSTSIETENAKDWCNIEFLDELEKDAKIIEETASNGEENK
jgi:hypothetical protein